MPKTLANNRINFLSLPGMVDRHELFLGQAVNLTSSPTFASINITGNATVQGDLTVNGATTIISTEVLEIKDNLIQINSAETGDGVSAGISGLEVNRGNFVSYHSIFRESDDTFRVGQAGSTQAVATRQDSPLSNGIMIYNSSQSRLDSVNNIPISIIISSNQASTASNNGALSVTGGIGVGGISNFDSRVYFRGSNYSNYIVSDNSNELSINSVTNILLAAAVGNFVRVPTNVGLSFGGNSNNITSNGTNVTFTSQGQISILGTAVELRNGSPLLFGTNDKITFSTDLTIDASVSLLVNPISRFVNNTVTTSSTTGAVRLSGGLSISNATDATSSTNGGTLTTAGGVAIAKKLFVGGSTVLTEFSGVRGTVNTLVLGNGSGDSSSCNINSIGNFIENVASSGSTVTRAAINYFGQGVLSSINPVTTNVSATVYIEGSPTAGANQTINETFSLFVNSGNSRINGSLNVDSLVSQGSINTASIISNSVSSNLLTVNATTKQESTSISGFHEIAAPTLTASSSNTSTITSTLAISGPIAGTNQVITNASALLIKTGNLTVNTVTPSTSSSGSVLLYGGITILNETDASSVTSGGGMTINGGLAVAKKLYVGGTTSTGPLISTNITSNNISTKKLVVTADITENYSEAAVAIIGGSNSYDNSLSGTVASANQTLLKSTTFNYSNPVTISNAATLRISSSPTPGINATFTKSYGLIVDTLSRLASTEFSSGVLLESTLGVSGAATLAQTSISTNTGQFTIAGSNGIAANVSGTVSIAGAGVTLDSSAALTLDGHSSVGIITTGALTVTAGTSSSINLASGTLSITAPITTFNSTTINLLADTVIFGNNNSDMVMGGNLTIGGNFTVQGTYTTINSQTVTVNDNVIVVNSMPLGISDGGLLVKRYQIPNNTGSGGQIIEDTPLFTGTFQSGSSTPGTLILQANSSAADNYYRGYWIKITSGACSGFVRRIKSYNGTTKAALVYLTADNVAPITDGLNMSIVPSSGDTYELFIGAYSGLFYSETADRWVMGKVAYDNGAGTFPLTVYDDLQVKDILIEGDLAFNGKLSIEAVEIDAFSISNSTVKLFNVDTVNSIVKIYDSSNTGVTSYDYAMGTTETIYSKTSSEIANSTTGRYLIKVLNAGVLEDYLVATGSSLVTTKDFVASDITSDSIVTGPLTATTTILGQCTTGLLLTSITTTGDPTFTTRSQGTIQVFKSQVNASNTDYSVGVSSDSLWHCIPQATASYFHSWFAGTTEIMALSGDGTLSVADIDISGSITGTWSGNTIAVARGGTGATSLASTKLLIGNGTSAVQTDNDLGYSSGLLTSPSLSLSSSTDSTSVSSGALVVTGGVGIAKKLYVGTCISIDTASSSLDVNLSGDAVIGNSTVDGSDNGSLSLASGGAALESRGSFIKLLGNEANGSVEIAAGNVSTTGTINFKTGGARALSILYNGSLALDSTLDATSSAGSLVTPGGISVAKKIYVGTDLTVIGTSALGTVTGTWSGNTIAVANGGTGATSLASTKLLIGNGTSAVQTDNNLGYSSNLLTVPKISLSDTTDTSSIGTGSFITPGGASIAKDCRIGQSIYVTDNVSIGTTQSISEITLAATSTISIDTALNSDNSYLSISGSGSSSASRGAVIRLYGTNNVGNPGTLLLSSGTASGSSIEFTTNGSIITISREGITTFKNTTASTSSSAASIIVPGGISISNSTNSSSSTNGGALTVTGGAAIDKNLYIGGNLIVAGTITGGTILTNPTLTTSSLSLLSGVTQHFCTLVTTGTFRNLTINFAATTTGLGDASFEFILPGATSVAAYTVNANVNGYFSDFAIQNIITREIVNTNRAKIQFTSAGTGVHLIQVQIVYIA